MAEPRTLEPGSLLIATVSPFPPFAVEREGAGSGFDAELMRAVCGRLGVRWNLLRFEGPDCNAIFDGLRTGDYDAVVAATSITPEREMVALFSTPYLEVDHALLVNATMSPHIAAVEDLATEVAGIERGRTDESVADALVGSGGVRDVRRYPCGDLAAMIDDLLTGRVGALILLSPIARWYARDHDELVTVEGLGEPERLGVAVAPDNTTLRDAVNEALEICRDEGTIGRLVHRWMDEDGSAR